MIKYVATPEQEEITDYFIDAIKNDDNSLIFPVIAPAGAGKTQLTVHAMEQAEKKLYEKRIGYFIFNKFMKDEISKRAYVADVHNTEFFTYHSFLLQHALKNEKIKSFFHDVEGNPIIDFAKQGYSKKEIENSIKFVLEGESESFMVDFGYGIFNDFLNSDAPLMDYAKEISNMLYYDEQELDELPKFVQTAIENLSSFNDMIIRHQAAIQKRVNVNDVPLEGLCAIFIAQTIRHIMKTNKLSHSAYYREVYDIALKNNINLFEDFDAIIVDEAQDMDKVFKRLIEISNKPVMVIGDPSQSIYGWRGAVNMMESAAKEHMPFYLSYSFRYGNDVAQFANLLLADKQKNSGIDVTGKHVPKIQNIHEGLISIDEFSQKVLDDIDRKLFRCEIINGVRPEEMKKKELTAYLSREKSAFISRNNSELISTLFRVVEKVKEDPRGEYVNFSLTDSVSEDLYKLKKCDFGARTNRKIEEFSNTSIVELRKDKTLSEMLGNGHVRNAVMEDKKLEFLLTEEGISNLEYLLDQLSSKKSDSISKSDKNANFVFTTVHGSKGKEYNHVFLASDILKEDKEGIISEEEYNIAYVAVTRTKGDMYFVQNADGTYQHPLQSAFIEKRSEIEEILSRDYTYTYPFNTKMEIKPFSDSLYQYTFSTLDGEEKILILDQLIRGGTMGFIGDEPQGIKFVDQNTKKFSYMDFEGETLPHPKNMTSFYYGVGMVDTKPSSEAKKKVIKMQHKISV